MWALEPWQWVAAIVLDIALGDPRGWPHMARLAGWLCPRYEELVTQRRGRTVKSGILFLLFMVLTMLFGYLLIGWILSFIHPFLCSLWEVFVVYQAIAARDLHEHVIAVLKPLKAGNLTEARERLSWIVGRDTQSLDESEISRATIESVGESACDGVMAPLFWSLLLGGAGAVIYRTVNTLDSMVGHRDEKYELFGKASAIVDDVLNWVPARMLAKFSVWWQGSFSMVEIGLEAERHKSPNAGWGEAALAKTLGVRLGGTNYYQGEASESVCFNEDGRRPVPSDLTSALVWMWKMTFTIALIGCVILYIVPHS